MHNVLTSEKSGWNSSETAEPNSAKHSRFVPVANLRRSTNSAMCFSASIVAPRRGHHEPLAPPPPELPPPNPPKPPPPPNPPPPPQPPPLLLPPPPRKKPSKNDISPQPPTRTRTPRNTSTTTSQITMLNTDGGRPLGTGYASGVGAAAPSSCT